MVKFPEPVHPLPPVSVHVPVTAPPVSALELDVPVTFPVSVRVFPAGVPDCTVYVKVPVTWFVESVVSVAVPLSTAPETKHVPVLMKLKPVMLSGPLLFTVNAVTKFKRLTSPITPVSCPYNFPLASLLHIR